MFRFAFPAAALVLTAAPAWAQSSYPTTIGSTPAPALGITPSITLGIAAAATANDRSASPSSYGATANARVSANGPAVPLRSSTR